MFATGPRKRSRGLSSTSQSRSPRPTVAIQSLPYHTGPVRSPGPCRHSCSVQIPPFGAIFIGALVGGVLAVFVAPERVIVFAGASDDTLTWLALLKGAWLALASGYVSKTGYPAIDMLVTPRHSPSAAW